MALKNPKTIPGSVCLGVITGSRGLKGEIKIKPFGNDPMTINRYGSLHDGMGHRLTILPKAVIKGLLMAHVDGVSDRNQADKLQGTALYIERDSLPVPNDDNEFYHADLVGLTAETRTGKPLGQISAIHDFGAGDVLELKGPEHGIIMIPFTKACVPEILIAEGRLIIEPPLGLLEPKEPSAQKGSLDDDK